MSTLNWARFPVFLIACLVSAGVPNIYSRDFSAIDGKSITTTGSFIESQPDGETSEQADSITKVIQSALDLMGGPEMLGRVHVIKTTERRLNFHLADSEHSQPPFIPDYVDAETWIDLSAPAMRTDLKVAAATGDERTVIQIIRDGYAVSRQIFNGKSLGGRVGFEPPRWALQNPILALLLALRSADLRQIDPAQLAGVQHRRATFTHHGYRVTLWINWFNNHLDAVDIFGVDPRDMFWNEWGDIHQRIIFSYWNYESGGLHYPHQADVYFNGDLQETRSIQTLSVNPEMKGVDMTVPSEGRPSTGVPTVDEFPLGRADRPITEIFSGIVQIPGNWYVAYVRQPDGVVVIDAPISNGYSRKVIDEINRRYPGAKIKAVVTTTNFWWHVAGIREYAARGIPIITSDQNVPFINKLLASPHTIAPDALQRSKRKPQAIGVEKPYFLGTGSNRLVLYPIRTATAQMLMVWVPGYKLLHTAEMAQPLGPNGSFLFPESLLELKRSVEANQLQVETIIGMHMSPTAWLKINEALSAVGGQDETHDYR